jgi:hypothetical protein
MFGYSEFNNQYLLLFNKYLNMYVELKKLCKRFLRHAFHLKK